MVSSGILRNRLVAVSLISSAIVLCGAVGYMFLEGYSFIEGLYMAVITLTTIGFGEVRPLSEKGRIFTMVLIVGGMAFIASQLAALGDYIADGQFWQLYRRRRMKAKIEKVRDHYIICGYGQMGKVVAAELTRHRFPVVVIEKAEEGIVRLEEQRIPYIAGDSTEEDVLIEAGIKRARGLVSVVSKDTDNVFIVLTARDLNKDLFICARAGSSGVEKRLKKAGADRIVSPYASGALRIAQSIIRPTVTDFLELALSGEGMELSLEEVRLSRDTPLVGKDLIGSQIRNTYNLIVVGIKRADGTMIYNPTPHEILREDDTLITIGPTKNLEQFVQDIYPRLSGERPCSCVLTEGRKNGGGGKSGL